MLTGPPRQIIVSEADAGALAKAVNDMAAHARMKLNELRIG
jgi:hypothetical protein